MTGYFIGGFFAVILLIFGVICIVGGHIYKKQVKAIVSKLPKEADSFFDWQGILPSVVDDYVKPRLVYENKVETTTPAPENGRVVGYRISPSLVIVDWMCGDCIWDRGQAQEFVKNHHGCTFLNLADVQLLRENWDEVNRLRSLVAQRPLPASYFWCMVNGTLEAGHGKEIINLSRTCAGMILKR